MTTATEQPMISAEELVRATASAYVVRLDVVRERIADYSAECQRRYATDEYHDTARGIRNSARWLAGDFDGTWAGQFGSLDAFRAHYADSALSEALHHLVWAEHYAGLHTRDAARALDPWD